ncbi:solute carrier family 2, facilitated glucose transporter member 8-like, partial [Stylophora pistillata]|uniref:solute carrier family 2, facilitated glucose transporter member 8-like n=1 Tax=Stylophora pistillata TaxID=50429 RepID=UPI000C03C5C6
MHSHSPQSNEMSVFQDRVGRSILATFIAALGTVSFGFCLGYSSSALVDLQSSDAPSAVRLSDDQASWFSSLVTIGAALGSAIGGWAIDKLGRKRTIMFCTVPLVLGWLLISYAKNVAMLYAGRIITGLGCGAVSLTVPVYIAEISAARVRGALGSVNNLAITVGLILAYVAGVFCHWRWLAFIGAIPPMLQIILLFPMPETPCWLLGKNRRSDALESLFWLRGPSADIEDECITIKETIDSHEELHLRELLSPEIAKPLAISVGLMALQMLSGVDAVEFNAAGIFATAGFSNGKLAAITVGLVQFVA